MPAISSTSVFSNLASRNVTDANSTTAALQVICAWPLSGQYGPGSRAVYYAFVIACVVARKSLWLRHACLAGALLFPAVAALHGIVLAAVHVNGAVDMDVYGAFQLCSIGILAAPVVVRVSETYFNDPRRNIIFLWTGILLIGLVSLTVEFFRLSTSPCFQDEFGNTISSHAGQFHYNTTCGLKCLDDDPVSPIRGGSANNIYVIPAPSKLTFNTATLLAAACCIPAILSLVTMWNKILKSNWKSSFGEANQDNETIEGTNGATEAKMKSVNKMVRFLLGAVEIPVLAGAILAILVTGEMNLFSRQVMYRTEPVATIGQWAPLVGTGLAILGSLYLVLTTSLESASQEAKRPTSKHICTCSMHGVDADTDLLRTFSHTVTPSAAAHISRRLSSSGERPSSEITPVASQPNMSPDRQAKPLDIGKRRLVARALISVSNYLGNASHEQFDISDFRRGEALGYPEIPGETNRNPDLPQLREQYNRPGSFTGSVASGLGGRERSATPSARSPTSPTTHGSTFPISPGSFEVPQPPTSASGGVTRGRQRHRGDTLTVPSAGQYGHTQNDISTGPIPFTITIPTRESSPAVVVSPEQATQSPVHTLVSSPLPSLTQPESP